MTQKSDHVRLLKPYLCCWVLCGTHCASPSISCPVARRFDLGVPLWLLSVTCSSYWLWKTHFFVSMEGFRDDAAYEHYVGAKEKRDRFHRRPGRERAADEHNIDAVSSRHGFDHRLDSGRTRSQSWTFTPVALRRPRWRGRLSTNTGHLGSTVTQRVPF